jgi:hypothetical protein
VNTKWVWRDQGVLRCASLVPRVFDYSLDGVIATEGTEFFQFCRDLPDDPAEDASGRRRR